MDHFKGVRPMAAAMSITFSNSLASSAATDMALANKKNAEII